ncbi:hypothetical protein OKW33_000750 [Paraburkholderia atlantica]|nr:hypothetical protein [Paraburkholderia atlantica]
MKKPDSLPGGALNSPRNVANLAADCTTGRHDADAPRQGQAATMTGASNNGTSMKIRLLSVACLASAAALLAACTIVTRNSNACEQLMRSKLAEPSSGMSSDRLRVTHRGAAIRGSRVVVEGTIEHVGSASATAASAPLAASASQAASEVEVAAKPAQPQRVRTPAAAECTFHGEQLDVFRWLAPPQLATPAAEPASASG